MSDYTQVAPRLPAHLGIVCKAVLVAGALLMGGWLLPATARAQAIPKGMVAFFPGTDCPAGWSAPEYPRGRLILGTTEENWVGRTYGTSPLGDREDRKHTHEYFAYFRPAPKAVCGACSCCNKQGARAGQQRVDARTEPATTRLPFIQYLVCEKN